MKKFMLLFFLFIAVPVFADDYIPFDDSFSMNFWFEGDSLYTPGVRELVAFVTEGGISQSSVILQRWESYYDFYVYSFYITDNTRSYGDWYYAYVTPGLHMLTLNYVSGETDFYIDAVEIGIVSNGILPVNVSGSVFLYDAVVSNSFTYSSDILTEPQIVSLFEDGVPSPIDSFFKSVSFTGLDINLGTLLVSFIGVGTVLAGYSILKGSV